MHDMRGCIDPALDAADQCALWSAQYMCADDSEVFLADMCIQCMVACANTVQWSNLDRRIATDKRNPLCRMIALMHTRLSLQMLLSDRGSAN
jgi:hypothetical protein